MNLFQIIAVLLTLTAVFGFINHRYIGLPTTIGIMFIAMIMSLLFLIAGKLGLAGPTERVASLLHEINFDKALLHGMLSFLLFAGALHVDINKLRQQRWVIALLAVGGVILSTFIIGALIWQLFRVLGIRLSLIHCLLFGALISPTDPIAVMGILKKAGIPKRLEVKIVGESLFNDGIAVVLFAVMLELATGTHALSAPHILKLFGEEALGGIALGYGAGFAACRLLRRVDSYQVEILITLALVTGVYALADAVHFSGPITIVIAGLLIGNHGRLTAMSESTREHLDTFWELIDEILNAILFVLIGLQVLVVPYRPEYLIGGLLTIPVVLLARLISVGIPINALRALRAFTPNAVMIMTWGGLRGGISVALALSLPPGTARNAIITMTYIVVVFSILVQGLTLGRLIARG